MKEVFVMRAISTAFVTLALAVFKPFGLAAWQWHAYVHLLMIFALGVVVCMFTDFLMKCLVLLSCRLKRKDVRLQADDHNIHYIIHHNLLFQLVNTPLIALMICLYRHFVLSGRVEGNQLSWSNYLETLVIIAFCSFTIGLYWRFKFRSRFLAAELEETRLLNEQLKKMQNVAPVRLPEKEEDRKAETADEVVLKGTTSESVAMQISHLLYIEAVGNYVKVYQWQEDRLRADMLRATSKQVEDELQAYPMIVRCHRAFLVNLGQVEQIVSRSGTMQLLMKHSHESVPVSRSNMAGIKEAIKGM